MNGKSIMPPRNTVLFTLERHNSKKMIEFNTTQNEKKLAWFSHHPASKWLRSWTQVFVIFHFQRESFVLAGLKMLLNSNNDTIKIIQSKGPKNTVLLVVTLLFICEISVVASINHKANKYEQKTDWNLSTTHTVEQKHGHTKTLLTYKLESTQH